jgi:hypothetical protein
MGGGPCRGADLRHLMTHAGGLGDAAPSESAPVAPSTSAVTLFACAANRIPGAYRLHLRRGPGIVTVQVPSDELPGGAAVV